MVIATEFDYLKRVEDFFKAFNSAADLKAGKAAYDNFLETGKETDANGAKIALGKIALTIASSVKDLPVFMNLPVLDVASLENNAQILIDSQNADGASDAIVLSILGDLSAIGTAASLATANIPLYMAFATFSFVASIYSTHRGLVIDSQNDQILQWATTSIDALDDYRDTSWSNYSSKIYTNYFVKNPVTMPVLLLMHQVDKNITPDTALSIIENSGITNLADGRISEASNTLNSLRQLLSGLGTPEASTKQDINTLVNMLWGEVENSPLAGNVQIVNVADSSVDQSAIWEDFSSFLPSACVSYAVYVKAP